MLLTDSASLPFPDPPPPPTAFFPWFDPTILGEDEFHTAQAKLHIMVENSLNHCA